MQVASVSTFASRLDRGLSLCNIRTIALAIHPPSGASMEAQDFVSKIHRLEKTDRTEICENGPRGAQGKMILLNKIMISNTFSSYVIVTLPPDNPGYTAGSAALAGF
jgi:hypothetical protein